MHASQTQSPDTPTKRGAYYLVGGWAGLQSGVNSISQIISGVREALQAVYGPSRSTKSPVGQADSRVCKAQGYLVSAGDFLALAYKVW